MYITVGSFKNVLSLEWMPFSSQACCCNEQAWQKTDLETAIEWENASENLKSSAQIGMSWDLTYHRTSSPDTAIRSVLLLWLEHTDGHISFSPLLDEISSAFSCCQGHISLQCTHLFLLCMYTKLWTAHLVHSCISCFHHQHFPRGNMRSYTRDWEWWGLCITEVLYLFIKGFITISADNLQPNNPFYRV